MDLAILGYFVIDWVHIVFLNGICALSLRFLASYLMGAFNWSSCLRGSLLK